MKNATATAIARGAKNVHANAKIIRMANVSVIVVNVQL